MRFTISICIMVLFMPVFSQENICPMGAERTPGKSSTLTISRKGTDFPAEYVAARMAVILDEQLIEDVRTGVSNGGAYVGQGNRNWNNNNGCLGCHTQTQSLLGLATSQDRADINADDTLYAYNLLASAVQNNGTILDSHTEVPESQTTLAVWSLIEWPNRRESLRAVVRGLEYLHGQRVVNPVNQQVHWETDHASGWWTFNEGSTAAIVKAACQAIQTLDQIGSVTDYRLGTPIEVSTSSSPISITSTGGMLYVLYVNGTVERINPLTGTRTEWASLTLSDPRSLAAAADGTIYVGGSGSVVAINSDQTTETFSISGNSTPLIKALEVGADGTVFLADYNNSRILTMSATGTVAVLVSGDGINNPTGLTLTPDGEVVVSNDRGNRYRLVRVDSTGLVHIQTDGFVMQTAELTANGSGNYYVLTGNTRSLGLTPGVDLIRGTGTIERLFSHPNNRMWRDVTVLDGTAWLLDLDNAIVPIEEFNMAETTLDTIAGYLDDVAEYLMDYSSSETENLRLAFRLIGLAEIRGCIDDQDLILRIDTALNDLETLLRNRQQTNGGWTRFEPPPRDGCEDALVTAWVGLALNYTHPEPDDTMVLNTVDFLLGIQADDGSWPLSGCDDLLSTRLATTSLVMAYMPDALEVLDPDLDDDGLENDVDNCPGQANPGQEDNDNDGLGDFCDPDDDNDGIIDALDNCPTTANANQADSDEDGLPDACGDDDDDNDGILDVNDNCPITANPNQADRDGDGIGDLCDGDSDNDGILDGLDNCPTMPNPDQADEDGDGIGDVCELPHVPIVGAAVVATTEQVMIFGGAVVDSFDSCKGAYGGPNLGTEGQVYAGTYIQVLDNAITGDRFPDTPSDSNPFDLPAELASSGDLFLSGSMTLAPGDYLFHNITLDSNASLIAGEGLVRIWFSGRLEMRSNAIARSSGSHAFNLWLFSTSTANSVHLQSNSGLYGAIYAPNIPVTVYSNAHVYGTVYGSRVELQANAYVHWNQSLPNRECLIVDPVAGLPAVPNALETVTGELRLQPGAYVDSYSSCVGNYGGSNITSQAGVQSAGSLYLEGNSMVYGTTSSQTASTAVSQPLPAGLVSSGDLNINGITTLAAGDYLFHNINIQGNAHLFGDTGLVRIFFTGNINIQSNGSAEGGSAGSLWFFDQGQNGNITLGSNALVRGVFYTPGLMLTLQSNGVLMGAAIAASLTVQTDGAIHYDTAMANGCNGN